MKFTLKEIIEMWEKTYNENMVNKHSKFIRNMILEYDNARAKKEDESKRGEQLPPPLETHL